MSYYTRHADSHGWGPQTAVLNPEKTRLLDKFAQGKVLDLGCGSGIYSYYLATHNHQVIAVDLQKEFIDKARSRYHHPHLTFQVASALALPFPDNSFDTVVAFDILEHLNDKQALFQIARLAKRVIISVPHRNQDILTRWSLAHHHYMDKTHLREYTLQSLKTLLHETSFRTIYLQPALPLSVYGFATDYFSHHNLFKKIILKTFLKLFIPKPPLYSTIFAVAETSK